MRDGVYGFARHPQYIGLYLVIIGFLVQWPTFLTVIMAPILVYAYFRLARSEERVIRQQFTEQYDQYARSTAMFLPPLNKWKEFLMVPVK